MVNKKDLKNEVLSFFLGISESDEYKNINLEHIKQGVEEDLNELTDIINDFLVEKVIPIFPKADPDMVFLSSKDPFDKMFQSFAQGKSTRIQRAQIYTLLKYAMEVSKREIPKWYEEVGYLYFEKYSGAKTLLNTLEAR